jgi:hypothetical protein
MRVGGIMTKSRWEQYKEKNGITPLELLNPNTIKVEDSVADRRYSICRACPEFINLTKQCKKCGCSMVLKTKFEEAKCPLGKW